MFTFSCAKSTVFCTGSFFVGSEIVAECGSLIVFIFGIDLNSMKKESFSDGYLNVSKLKGSPQSSELDSSIHSSYE